MVTELIEPPVTTVLPRTIYNPIQQDWATFLETHEETNGQRTLIEVEVAPGGGNGLHYHREFSERFQVLDGELRVQVADQLFDLQPGDSATASVGQLHCFRNQTDSPTRFLVEIKPGHIGFEQALRIGYGLATDGFTNSKGLPKNLYHLALLVELSGTSITGPLALLSPVFRYLAQRARGKGIDRELFDKYC